MARLRRLSRIQASRSASPSHHSRQRSALQPFLTPIFSTVLCSLLRAIGTAEALVNKAAEIGQKWLRGVVFARYLKKAPG